MTKKSKKQIEYTLATHAVEHLTPSEEALGLCERLSEGTIPIEAAVAQIIQKYGLRQAKVRE